MTAVAVTHLHHFLLCGPLLSPDCASVPPLCPTQLAQHTALDSQIIQRLAFRLQVNMHPVTCFIVHPTRPPPHRSNHSHKHCHVTSEPATDPPRAAAALAGCC